MTGVSHVPTRVVFFLQGRNVPAARARGYLVANALERAGIACELRVPQPSVYGDTGIAYPWNWMRYLFRPASAIVQLVHVRDLHPTDVVFLQRPLIEFPITNLEEIATRGRRSVFDFDDAIFLGLGNDRKIRRIIERVDHVITGNQYLAEFAGVPDKTTVIPTVVDTAKFSPQPTRNRRGREVVIGWTGLRGNYPQLMTALPALRRVLERTNAKLRLISNGTPPRELMELGGEYVVWNPTTEVADLAEIDIGLMPLPDTQFTRGKCAFKVIQYMALGRPAVASPVGVNREVVTDGVDGFLPQTTDEWEARLVDLIDSPDLRARVGEAASTRIEQAYSLASVVPRYLTVLEQLGVTPRASQP